MNPSSGSKAGLLLKNTAARSGIPCDLGPRTFDWSSSREGQWIGTPERYEAAGVRPEKIKTKDDIRRIPIVRKKDILEDARVKPPYGRRLQVPIEEILGTARAPKPERSSGLPMSALFLMAVALVLFLTGNIWLIVVGFKHSLLWGVLMLLFSPCQALFVCFHWQEAKRPFLVEMAGGAKPDEAPSKPTDSPPVIDIKRSNPTVISPGGSQPVADENAAEALLKTANQQFLLGKYGQAANTYEAALRAGASPGSTNQRIGQSYTNGGNRDAAAAAYRRAISSYEGSIARGGENPRTRAALEACKQALKVLGG